PRRGVAVTDAADAQTLALAKRVIREPRMRSDGPAFRRDDRPRVARQIPREEIAKRPLADEADAGRILLVPRRYPLAPRDRANFRLPDRPQRKYRRRELRLRQSMEEVALVLGLVDRLQQLD